MGKTKAKTKDASAYTDVKQVLESGDSADRARLAACDDVAPEILYYLADDDSADVRCVVAGNPACPAQADLNLASDPKAIVRLRLAEKVAQRLPQMTAEEIQGRLFEQLLGTLAQDEAMAVRQVVAEATKALTCLPQEVAYRLAEDSVDAIACPVLSDSPVLTDAQLAQLVARYAEAQQRADEAERGDARMIAVAGRRVVSMDLVARLIESDDDKVIGKVIENDGAEIADEALEELAEKAETKPAWHAPLVSRPRLTSKAVLSLVRYVAESLLQSLRRRSDLDAHTLSVVEREMQSRLSQTAAGAGPRDEEDEQAMARAAELLAQGRLNSEELSEVLMDGDERLVAAGLALLSDYNMAFVRHVRDAKSAKGVVALAWKAGLTPRFASQLQVAWAHIPRPQVLPTTDGTFPLSKEAMEWQLEFLEGLRE